MIMQDVCQIRKGTDESSRHCNQIPWEITSTPTRPKLLHRQIPMADIIILLSPRSITRSTLSDNHTNNIHATHKNNRTHHFIITKPKNSIAVITSNSLLNIVNAKHVSVTSHRIFSPIVSLSFGLNPPSKNNFVNRVKELTANAIIAFPNSM